MKNSLSNNSLPNNSLPILEPLPIPLSTNQNTDNVFSYDTFSVAVNYYVLRPQKEKNS